MTVSPDIKSKIKLLIQAFIKHSQDAVHTMSLQRSVHEFEALPLAFNFDCYAIKPNGDIIIFELENPSKFEIEKNPRIINTVLFSGIKKYPDLKELMPVRSATDVDCPYCEGSGVEPTAEKLNLTDKIACWCGGLGWIPENSR
jgi:hypothetical protein